VRVILLSAGLGQRLRPITNNVPKCLVEIKGIPLLQVWLDRLTQEDLGPFLVNTHYLHNQVNDFIDISSYREHVKLVHEPILLGTAGTLRKNIDFFEGEDGLLIHADNYCLANFNEFIEAHENRPSNCLMTMMTFRTETPSSCGIVELDENNVVVGFHEKVDSPPDNLANGAIYILSKELIEILKADGSMIDFSNEVLPDLVGKIYTYETQETFIDIGTPDTYKKANKL
tara:strand:- start:289 stop:975 length:687 start_codon:yes stop_codon:yes gene_type:complete